MSPHLVSIQVGHDEESATQEQPEKDPIRVIAYLLDVQTIRLSNLVTQNTL